MTPPNQTLHILPLRLTPHSDRTSILQAYSREFGAISFAVPAKRRALFQPLTPLEVEAAIRPVRDLQSLRNPRIMMHTHTLLTDPARSAVAMFLAEALQIILRQADADPIIFDYIIDAIAKLNDPAVKPANFHLTFMIGLSVVLGIAPDASSYHRGKIFDMVDGIFRDSPALHGRNLSPEASSIAATILRLNWQNMSRLRIPAHVRAEALERILEYFTLHYANLSAMKSPSVLHALFH